VTFVGIVKSRLTAYAVEKFLNAYKFDREKVDKYSLPGRKKITSKSYVHLGLSAVEFNLENFLKGLKKPTLIIYGEKERYVKPEHAREILAEIGNPAIKMVVVDRSGHNPAYEQPEQTAKIIEKFIG
jgi:pimeloyl-ACP methyl ester carboxylesterase